MTTFGYAYHKDRDEILKGRRAFAKVRAIMCELDGVAYDTANDLVRKIYAPEASRFGILELGLLRQARSPLGASLLQAQLEAQRRAMGQSSGLFGGAFGSLL